MSGKLNIDGVKKLGVFAFILMLISVSCSREEMDKSEPDTSESAGAPSIALKIGAVGTRTTGNSISEKIKTLRIIMLSDGFIETNQLINYEKAEGSTAGITDADLFSQKFEHITVAGSKKFYLIANEESVSEIKFEDVSDLPEWWEEGFTLSDLLNHYAKDNLPSDGTTGYPGTGSGVELERLLSAAYFNPDFSVTDNNIYLPYTAVYDGITANNDMSVKITKNMYLVPVATKFTFHFYNYRKEDVEVQKIELHELNSQSFVMPHLDESELTKTLDGQSYYWIDWLRIVAEGSHAFEDFYEDSDDELLEYNDKAGWIDDYFLPKNDKEIVKSIERSQNDDWSIQHLIDKDAPSALTVVEYYPESIHLETKRVYNSETKRYEDVDLQTYYAQFSVKDINTGLPVETYVTELMEIDKVRSLFRATHVIIDIDMFESLVEIYCQIAPWNVRRFQGYVQEDEDY